MIVFLFIIENHAYANDTQQIKNALEENEPDIFSVYDKEKWDAITNKDNSKMLSHKSIKDCFVTNEPEYDFGEGSYVKSFTKLIGGTSYDISMAYYDDDLFEIVYSPSKDEYPRIGVFSGGACQSEAEKIIESYESIIKK